MTSGRVGVGRMESVDEIQYRMDVGSPKPRPRLYHGIEFRSSLEARFAQWLDSLREPWIYEPCVYGPSGRGYLPLARSGQWTWWQERWAW